MSCRNAFGRKWNSTAPTWNFMSLSSQPHSRHAFLHHNKIISLEFRRSHRTRRSYTGHNTHNHHKMLSIRGQIKALDGNDDGEMLRGMRKVNKFCSIFPEAIARGRALPFVWKWRKSTGVTYPNINKNSWKSVNVRQGTWQIKSQYNASQFVYWTELLYCVTRWKPGVQCLHNLSQFGYYVPICFQQISELSRGIRSQHFPT